MHHIPSPFILYVTVIQWKVLIFPLPVSDVLCHVYFHILPLIITFVMHSS